MKPNAPGTWTGAAALLLALTNAQCGARSGVLSTAAVPSACEGRAVDTAVDLDNCGACGALCRTVAPSTAACVAGRCVITLADGTGATGPDAALDGFNSFAVDHSYVYAASSLVGILSVPVGGGPAVPIAHTTGAESIAVDAASIYWTAPGKDTGLRIMKLPKTGGEPIVLAAGPVLGNIVVDGVNVYFVGDGGDSVFKVPVRGGDVVRLASGEGSAARIAVSGASVYWTVKERDFCRGRIRKVDVDGGRATTVYAGPRPDGIAIEGGNLCYVQRQDWRTCEPPDGPADRGIVGRIGIAGNTPVVLADEQATPLAIAVDATSAYWANDGFATHGGAIVKEGLGGGAPSVVANFAAAPFLMDDYGRYPYAVAVDANSVYWLATDQNLVGYYLMKATPK